MKGPLVSSPGRCTALVNHWACIRNFKWSMALRQGRPSFENYTVRSSPTPCPIGPVNIRTNVFIRFLPSNMMSSTSADYLNSHKTDAKLGEVLRESGPLPHTTPTTPAHPKPTRSPRPSHSAPPPGSVYAPSRPTPPRYHPGRLLKPCRTSAAPPGHQRALLTP